MAGDTIYLSVVDRDGNELSGIRLPNVAVPLATYTGWNFRNPSIGQPGELLPLTGSYIPFPVTKGAREEARDPLPYWPRLRPPTPGHGWPGRAVPSCRRCAKDGCAATRATESPDAAARFAPQRTPTRRKLPPQ